MEIKLINKNAETLEKAYGLSNEDIKELTVNFILNYRNNNFNNIYEVIIPLLIFLDSKTLNSAIKIINTLEDTGIKNVVELTEYLRKLDSLFLRKYLKIIYLLVDYKDELLNDYTSKEKNENENEPKD